MRNSKHLLFSVKRFLLIQYMKQNATEVCEIFVVNLLTSKEV